MRWPLDASTLADQPSLKLFFQPIKCVIKLCVLVGGVDRVDKYFKQDRATNTPQIRPLTGKQID